MKSLTLALSAALTMTMPGVTPSALADSLSLYNWGFNVDGAIIDKANTPGPLPSVVDASGFNFVEGLGTLTITVAGPGPHSVGLYFDHNLNGLQFATDNSAVAGTPSAGESWEIGTGSEGGGTQLFADFQANNYDDLDNSPGPADVATGLGFDFITTPADPVGVVTITVSESPTSGFYLHQWNDTSGTSPSDIYISASEANSAVPEPATGLLLLTPLAVLAWRYSVLKKAINAARS